MRDERRMTATAGTPTTASIFASRQTPVVACVGQVLVFYVASDTPATSGQGPTPLVRRLVVDSLYNKLYNKIHSKSTRKLYNKSATNPQQIDSLQQCTTSRHVEILYNKSTSTTSVQQICSKSTTNRTAVQQVRNIPQQIDSLQRMHNISTYQDIV